MDKKNDRYSRQMLLKEIGKKQEILMNCTIAVVGLGALGTNVSQLLVRAGIENLILIDNDKIEESNLQRQTLFTEKDIKKDKVLTAKQKLTEINSGAKIIACKFFLTKKNASLLDQADLVIDCTDNLKTRFIINEYCRKNKKTWIFSSAVKAAGYVMPIFPGGPCLECFIKENINETQLDSACTAGILNTIVASIASLAVTLAMKIILKEKVEPELYYYNIWEPELKKLKIKQNPKCRLCKIN